MHNARKQSEGRYVGQGQAFEQKAFNRRRLQWLNGVCEDCSISPTAFRAAYVIAGYVNRAVGYAWPSKATIADKMCVSAKSVQRAIRELKQRGWLKVAQLNRDTNRYWLSWPTKSVEAQGAEQDKSVLKTGRNRPLGEVKNVPQSYLDNLSRTYSSESGEGALRHVLFKDRGLYEQRIIAKYGESAQELLETLNEVDPAALDALCDAEKHGALTQNYLDALRLDLASSRL